MNDEVWNKFRIEVKAMVDKVGLCEEVDEISADTLTLRQQYSRGTSVQLDFERHDKTIHCLLLWGWDGSEECNWDEKLLKTPSIETVKDLWKKAENDLIEQLVDEVTNEYPPVVIKKAAEFYNVKK